MLRPLSLHEFFCCSFPFTYPSSGFSNCVCVCVSLLCLNLHPAQTYTNNKYVPIPPNQETPLLLSHRYRCRYRYRYRVTTTLTIKCKMCKMLKINYIQFNMTQISCLWFDGSFTQLHWSQFSTFCNNFGESEFVRIFLFATKRLVYCNVVQCI